MRRYKLLDSEDSELSITVKTVKSESFSMDYFSFGTGSKPFVILPGLSVQSVMNSCDFISQAYSRFSEDYKVYVFDRRKELPADYSIYDMADDTAEAFKALGLEEVCLFGASQGGMIALTLAARYPKLVKKLVLGSSCAVVTEEHFLTLDKWIKLAKERNGLDLFLQMCRDIYPANMYEEYRETFYVIGKSINNDEMDRFVVLAEGTENFDISSEIININCPVLSIGVSDDAVLPGGAERINELFDDKPDFESYMYTGFGHAAFDTAPDYKDRLFDFFSNGE